MLVQVGAQVIPTEYPELEQFKRDHNRIEKACLEADLSDQSSDGEEPGGADTTSSV